MSPALSGPPVLATVELADEIRPRWWTAGPCRFPFPFPRLARGLTLPGEPLAWIDADAGPRPLITRASGRLHLAFDPAETFSHLTEERYTNVPAPVTSRLPFHYHRIPHALRLLLGRMTERWRSRKRTSPFPQWPIEPGWTILSGLLGPGTPGAPPVWPDGARVAFALCHDVDDAEGVRHIRTLRAIDEEHGFRACWYVVGRHYGHDEALYDSLLSSGHEIGLHDYNHDNRLASLPPREIRRRLEACRPLIERFRIAGFRSASLVRSGPMFDILPKHVRYDSTIPDTDSGAGGGVVAPFRHHGLVELPLTLPLDSTLILAGLSPREVLAIWRMKWEWLREVGGLAVLTAHPEPHFSANPKYLRVYAQFLSEVAESQGVWRATPRGIAEFWERSSAAPVSGRGTSA